MGNELERWEPIAEDFGDDPDPAVDFDPKAPEEHLQESVQALTAAVRELIEVMRRMDGVTVLPRRD